MDDIVAESNLILKYSKSILNKNSYAYGGSVNYSSTDCVFEKYLNASTRGIKKYKNNQNINYQNLLFSNCLIKKSIFDLIQFNLNLKGYGGEELEFAYRLNEKFPQQIAACKTAIVTRANHPKLKQHCLRLEQFGKINFPLLSPTLQQSVVQYRLLLKKHFILKYLFLFLNWGSFKLYQIGLGSFRIIRIVMLTSILRGYYKNTK